jgi:hypothetical protein
MVVVIGEGQISGETLLEQVTQFLQKAKKDEEWAQEQLIDFIITLDEGEGKKKIKAGTIRNYYKVVKVFCDLHRIRLEWPRIARYIGKVRKIADDRSLDEMKKWMEYPDKNEVYYINNVFM